MLTRTIPSALLVVSLALAGAACKEKSTTPARTSAPIGVTEPSAGAASPNLRTGAELYRDSGCIACHGQSGEGGMLGPSLDGMGAHWNRTDMAAFFAAPEPFVRDRERLAEQRKARTYTMAMPAVSNLSEAERLVLADWVLAR